MNEQLIDQMHSLLSEEDWFITNLSNGAALLKEEIEDINWAGFYLVKGNELALGPFQGKTACTRIPFGKGVCGTAALENKTLRVADTRLFQGHIACDCDSRSEIVVPLRSEAGTVIGVMDIDSTSVGRFSESDQRILESAAQTVERAIGRTLVRNMEKSE